MDFFAVCDCASLSRYLAVLARAQGISNRFFAVRSDRVSMDVITLPLLLCFQIDILFRGSALGIVQIQ